MVRSNVDRDAATGKRKYIGKAIHSGLRAAQAHLNKMLVRAVRGWPELIGPVKRGSVRLPRRLGECNTRPEKNPNRPVLYQNPMHL
jgi:hypothetical protein